jgi:dihydroorotase
VLSDDLLDGFDTNYKLLPPLRTNKDCKALIKGLIDGTIDGITSDHNPLDIEHKKTEFDHAMYGSIGLENCFGSSNKILSTEKVIDRLTNLKKRFKIKSNAISEGNKADLTLFNPKIEWIFTEEDIHSTSKNSAFIDQPLRGKVYGIFSNKKLILNK